MKKLISIVLCIIMAMSLCACGHSESAFVGSGTPGELDKQDWTVFDNYLIEANSSTDLEYRSYLLHKAEDILMDTGAIIPLFNSGVSYLCKENVKNAYITPGGISEIRYIEVEGQDPSIPVGVSLGGDPENIDPDYEMTSNLSRIVEATQGYLYRINKDGKYIGDLAESYDISDDGKTYTFHLRDNLKWSDGSDLTAEDFVYSWKRLTYSKNGFQAGELLDVIEGYPDNLNIEASDDGKDFTVHLSNPCAYFIALAGYTSMTPVKREYVENADGYLDASGNVINPSAFGREPGAPSCGAYHVDTWKHKESMVLKKNPYYYDAENVVTETIEMMFTSDASVTYGAYVTGDIVFCGSTIPTDILPTLMGTPEYHFSQNFNVTSIYCNVNADIFKGMTWEESKTFRQALSYAIDREFMTKVALGGNQQIATTYVPKLMHDSTGRTFGDLTEGYEYPIDGGYFSPHQDLDKARELLMLIGYEFGDDGKLKHPVTIEYLYNGAAINDAVATCLQADLAMIGINLSLRKSEFAVYLGERSKGSYEFARGGWTADYDDPYAMLALFKTDSTSNDVFLGR